MLISLSKLKFGSTGHVKEIRKFRHELGCMGVRVGKQVRMVTKQPIKGPVVILSGNDEVEVAMGLEIADEIIIDIEEKSPGN